MPEKNRTDPTYVLLSSVFNYILLKDGAENIDKSNLSYHLQQIKRNFESILEDDEDPGENETKKCVKEGLFWVEKLENEFEIESLNNPIKKYTEEDAAFIEEQTKGKKTIPWKEIFNKGKSKKLLNSYTSSNSLKSSYYNMKKRNNKKQ